MVQLLKIKEHIYRFIGKYEIYAMAVFRFLVAFLAFSLINHQIGYMDILKEYPIALLCALLCSFLPSGMMLFFGALLILLNCYALSLELCGIVALIFVALFCIYYRLPIKRCISIWQHLQQRQLSFPVSEDLVWIMQERLQSFSVLPCSLA